HLYLAPISGTTAIRRVAQYPSVLRRQTWDTVELIVEIVILAMIAAFLGLRLYSVLGRRAEHEEEPVPTRFERPEGGNAPRAVPSPVAELPRRNREIAGFPPAIEQGLREIS